MNSSFGALLLLGLATGSAGAQAPGCTYETCALRLRSRFWSGVSVVQGHDARRVARLGLFAPHIDLLASGSDSTKAHYLAFRAKQNTGGGAKQVSASDHLQQAIWFYNRDLGR